MGRTERRGAELPADEAPEGGLAGVEGDWVGGGEVDGPGAAVEVAGRVGAGMGAVGESSPDAAAAVIAFVAAGVAMAVAPIDVIGEAGELITGGSGVSGGSGLTGVGAGGIVGHSLVVPGGFPVGGAVEDVDDAISDGTPGDGEPPLVGLAGGAAPGGVIGDTCGDWLSTGILPRSVIEMCHDDRSELGLAEVERAASLPGSTDVTRR